MTLSTSELNQMKDTLNHFVQISTPARLQIQLLHMYPNYKINWHEENTGDMTEISQMLNTNVLQQNLAPGPIGEPMRLTNLSV